MIICDYVGQLEPDDVKPRTMLLLFKTSKIAIMTDLGYFLDWAQKAKESDSLLTTKYARHDFDAWYKEAYPLVYIEAEDVTAEQAKAKKQES